MERRFTALRIIAVIFKVLAVLVLLFGLVAFLGIVAGPALPPEAFDQMPFGRMPMMRFFPVPAVAGLAFLVGALVQALVLYAAGQGIELLLALEENTRVTAAELAHRRPTPERVEPATRPTEEA